MIECPFCTKRVIIYDQICPECRHEVLLDYDGNINFELMEIDEEDAIQESIYENIEEVIMSHFKCVKCKCRECIVKEVAMTGTGLSKMFDIQYNHYLFVSCENCGYVEVYNPDILRNKKQGTLGTVLDILFGG